MLCTSFPSIHPLMYHGAVNYHPSEIIYHSLSQIKTHLQVNVDARWTAEQLLAHPFLKTAAPNKQILPLIETTKKAKGSY